MNLPIIGQECHTPKGLGIVIEFKTWRGGVLQEISVKSIADDVVTNFAPHNVKLKPAGWIYE